MSHSHVNQLIHIMWSTHNSNYSIPEILRNDLNAYLTALVISKDGKTIQTGSANDHVHLLVLLSPKFSLSSFINFLKSNSSRWLKTQDSVAPDFSWQKGYLAVSTQEEQVDQVCTYIKSDEQRHQKESYEEELLRILNLQKIPYNDHFLSTNHSKILTHLIWSTNNRERTLIPGVREKLYEQISTTISLYHGKVHEIGGVEDHVHILFENPKQMSLSDLLREIKTSSSLWLKNNGESQIKNFSWQTGYGAFSVSLSHFETVKAYIQKQEQHHKNVSPEEEWQNILSKKGWSYI
jgi:putative transposase